MKTTELSVTDAGSRLTPPPSPIRMWIAILGLASCVLVVALATLTPTPLDRGIEATIERLLEILHNRGIPEWFGYRKLEFTANVAMFLPLGFLLAIALPARRQWVAFLLLPILSAALEGMQAAFLAERYGNVLDVVANSLGGWLGALAAVALRAAVHARDRRIIDYAVAATRGNA